MDANGRVEGDRGYDPRIEQGYQLQQPERSNQSLYGKLGEPESNTPSASEQWRIDNPAQPMAPIDYSAAPAWWGKGDSIDSSSGTGVQPPVQQQPSAVSPSTSPQSKMINILGDTGGMTGLIGQRAMANALRSGGQ